MEKREHTDDEIKAAYSVARTIAKSLISRFRSSHDHIMDLDDFVQEGMLGWLEGRSMYHAMVRAFGKAAKMSQYSYVVKGMSEPRTVDVDTFAQHESGEETVAAELDRKVDAAKILDRIQKIRSEQARFAVLGYLYFGMSLRDLAEVFGKSHEWVRVYLVEPELTKLREEFAC